MLYFYIYVLKFFRANLLLLIIHDLQQTEPGTNHTNLSHSILPPTTYDIKQFLSTTYILNPTHLELAPTYHQQPTTFNMPPQQPPMKIMTLWNGRQNGFILTITAIVRVLWKQQELHDDAMIQFQSLTYGIQDLNDKFPTGDLLSQDDIREVVEITEAATHEIGSVRAENAVANGDIKKMLDMMGKMHNEMV